MIDTIMLQEKIRMQNMSISTLANRSGVNKSVISRLLRGESENCTIGTAHKLSEALHLSGEESSHIFLQ